MLYSLSRRIADFLYKENCFEEKLMPVYIYGVELFLSSLLGVTLVIAASLFVANLQCGVLFLASFIFLRLFTGGLHCNSYTLCNTCMILCFLSVCFLQKAIETTPFRQGIYCLMSAFSIIITATSAPLSNPNKEVPGHKKRTHRLISLCILLAHFLLYITLNKYLSTGVIIVTDFASSAFIIIGLIKNKTERRMSDETQKELC